MLAKLLPTESGAQGIEVGAAHWFTPLLPPFVACYLCVFYHSHRSLGMRSFPMESRITPVPHPGTPSRTSATSSGNLKEGKRLFSSSKTSPPSAESPPWNIAIWKKISASTSEISKTPCESSALCVGGRTHCHPGFSRFLKSSNHDYKSGLFWLRIGESLSP